MHEVLNKIRGTVTRGYVGAVVSRNLMEDIVALENVLLVANIILTLPLEANVSFLMIIAILIFIIITTHGFGFWLDL
jgi:hypothetical protein